MFLSCLEGSADGGTYRVLPTPKEALNNSPVRALHYVQAVANSD